MQLSDSTSLAGRVGFIRLDVPAPKTHLDAVDLHGQPGVLGRADEFVETAPEFAALAERLLGKTWIVERSSHALALSEADGAAELRHPRRRTGLRPTARCTLGPRQHVDAG